MILGPISLLDCAVFVILLIPQLLIQAGLFSTILLVFQVLPFLVFALPKQLCHERYYLPPNKKSPFCQNASFFQDLVIRCVRYAFANIPASVGRVFFSKQVAHPFFRFRLLRHGYLYCPIHYQEIHRQGVRGLWIIPEPTKKPDVIVYYCHGGGFSMGSAYFYLEFLISWVTCLQERGYRNPAIFALEYTLVPDAQWPTQFNETREGYQFLRHSFGEESASRICVSGDSAGATLILSMLLHPAPYNQEVQFDKLGRPGLAVLLSPWTHLVSELNRNTPSDYLDRDSLHLYATQYAGKSAQDKPVISPGVTRENWNRVSPQAGYRIIYGSEEVFGPGIKEMVENIQADGAFVKVEVEPAGIHAWPVVNLFLGSSRKERLSGLKIMSEQVSSAIATPKAEIE